MLNKKSLHSLTPLGAIREASRKRKPPQFICGIGFPPKLSQEAQKCGLGVYPPEAPFVRRATAEPEG